MPDPNETYAWLAEILGIPVFQEAFSGALTMNSAARRLIGKRKASRVQDILRELGDGLDSSALESTIEAGRNGKHQSLLIQAKQEFGGSSWQAIVVPVADGWQLWLAPAALGQSFEVQKRAAMADAAASVSHELSNALGAILGWAQMGRSTAKLPDPAIRAFSHIEQSASAANAITRSILEASSDGIVKNSEIDLSTLLRQIEILLGPAATKAKVTLRASIEDNLAIKCPRTNVWTISWNLIKNAIEASPEGASVEIQARRDGKNILLIIEDHGPGMSAELKRESFVPYFTTKTNGTGLGLALVKKAVDHMKGHIELYTAPNEGTRFTVSLPAAKQSAEATSAIRKVSSGIHQSDAPLKVKVLVIEDDFALKELVATGLSLQGAEVTAVRSGRDALVLEDHFDVAIVDMHLIDMRGDELLAILRNKDVVQHAIMVSGQPRPASLVKNGEANLWLRKPYDIQRLKSAIHELHAEADLKAHTA